MGILKNLGDLQRVTDGLDCLAGGLVIVLQRGLSALARRLNLEEPARKRGSMGTQLRRQGIVSELRSFLSYSAALGHNRWRLEAPSFHRLCTTLLQLSRAVTFHFCHGVSQDGYTLSVFVGAQRSCLDDRLDAGSSGRINQLENNRGRKH